MTVGVFAATVVALVALPAVIDRWAAGRAAPVQLVTRAMVRLMGLVLVPTVAAVCAAQLLGHHHDPGRAWVFAAAGALAAGTLGRAGAAVWTARGQWRAASVALAATGTPDGRGVVIIPLDSPIGFVAGPYLAVSIGLLDRLSPEETEAVIAHETAHRDGGHPRLAAWAHGLRQGSFSIPPARAAEARVRQQLEVIADRHAAAALDDPEPVRTAVTKLAAAHPLGPALPGTVSCVDDRLQCLGPDQPATDGAATIVATTTGVVAAATVAVVCGALHLDLVGVGVAVCGLTAVALVGLFQPLHRNRLRRTASTPHVP